MSLGYNKNKDMAQLGYKEYCNEKQNMLNSGVKLSSNKMAQFHMKNLDSRAIELRKLSAANDLRARNRKKTSQKYLNRLMVPNQHHEYDCLYLRLLFHLHALMAH